MSTATKNKPATGTSNAPPAAPANEPAFGSGGSKPPVECFMTAPEFDEIHTGLYRADAVVRCLIHVFGGDANLKEPAKVTGLFGTLQAATGLMARVNTVLQNHNALPDQLSLNVEQALSLLQLIERLQVADAHEWRWSDDWYCAYFDAASGCIESALKAMDGQVKTRKAAA